MWHAWGRGDVFTGFSAWRPERKKPRKTPRRTWENTLKTDLRKIGIDGAKCIRLAQDRVNRDQATGWTTWAQLTAGDNYTIFSLRHRIQTVSGAYSASYPMSNGGCFLGIRRRMHESGHSPPSSAKVKN